MQEKVCNLQDEFGASMVIEDNEARTLMASAALKSCQETLALLQERQKRSAEDAVKEWERINNSWEKLKSLKDEFLSSEINPENPQAKDGPLKPVEGLESKHQEVSSDTEERQDMELLCEKIKENFEVGSSACVTMGELAEKIDKLVNKIINLEASVSSQTALIQRLRLETNELHAHFTEARSNIDHLSEKLQSVKFDEDFEVKPSSMDDPNVEVWEQETMLVDEPDWNQLFMNGMENREQVMLREYTTILRNYKELKKQLTEAEKKNGDSLLDTTVQVRVLKNGNEKKDEQIQFLRQKLILLQAGLGEDSKPVESMVEEQEVTENIKVILMDQPETTSEIENLFRMNIDEVLEENLNFWSRFITTFQQIQIFETEVQDIQSELFKLEEKQNMQDGSNAKYSLKWDARTLYKYLGEIHTELTAWLEKSRQVKDEVKRRFASLCDIQDEITAVLTESAEDDEFKFTSHQAAKFQCEILTMKQENNKVADVMQAGLDHITTLQLEVERTLAKLNEEFKLGGSKHRQLPHSESRSPVPLRSFIFGIKPKKQKNSIFSCMHPAMNRRHLR